MFWAHSGASRRNRAFRSKSSDLPMQILWAFRYNPIARAPAANCSHKSRSHNCAACPRRQLWNQIA
ncbi:MAG: hypothetical protein LBK44_04950 [Spirochaetales bacterium]|nr:hypothetical protein [Spirochaetales bacterium]